MATPPKPPPKKERRNWADESEDTFGSPDFEPIKPPTFAQMQPLGGGVPGG